MLKAAAHGLAVKVHSCKRETAHTHVAERKVTMTRPWPAHWLPGPVWRLHNMPEQDDLES